VEKFIIKWSYLGGITAMVLAFVVRAVDVINPRLSTIPTGGDRIGYMAFVHAASLLFITTVATTCYAWAKVHYAATTTEREPAKNFASRQPLPSDLA
jgi:hypothetical protein